MTLNKTGMPKNFIIEDEEAMRKTVVKLLLQAG